MMSARFRRAAKAVPATKPNWTAVVSHPTWEAREAPSELKFRTHGAGGKPDRHGQKLRQGKEGEDSPTFPFGALRQGAGTIRGPRPASPGETSAPSGRRAAHPFHRSTPRVP